MWHTPIGDFKNLLRRAGQPAEVVKLAEEAVAGCPVCRKYVRLRTHEEAGAGSASSLIPHETGAESERLGITRCPRGTTSGDAGKKHTGTGLVERHVQLTKLTMLKLHAELARQGLVPEWKEIALEAAMAHNITLNYGGVTPSMSVFGVLPCGFYEEDTTGVLATAGALQTDLSVFARAMRIRQTALASTHRAIIEDRVARASRTRMSTLTSISTTVFLRISSLAGSSGISRLLWKRWMRHVSSLRNPLTFFILR